MLIIHAETDALRETGRAFEIACLDLDDSYREMRTEAYRLEANWQGGAAGTFQAELQDCLRTLAEKSDLLDGLARELIRQAEGWEELDQRWAEAYRGMIPAQEEAIRA